jgi:hypothetical protein
MAHLHSKNGGTTQAGALAAYRAKRLRLTFWFAVAGAFSFWLPDVAVHFHAGPNLDSRHILVITILLPATFLFAYSVTRKFAAKRDFKWPGAAMVLGVWLSGGLFMTLAAIVSGSEFVGASGVWRLVVILLSVIPIVTYLLSASDGSLFALLALTVGALLFCGLRASRMLLASAPPHSLSPANSAQRSKVA